MDDLLVVYNTFGLRDNHEHYSKCIDSILNCSFNGKGRVVISSVCNSDFCRQYLISRYGDRVVYSHIDKKVPVNVTFNKTVQMCVKAFGEFKNYLYVDSGVDFIGNDNSIQRALDVMSTGNYGILSYQVSNDNALNNVGINDFPLRGRNHEVPVGTACNGHSEMFSNDIFKTFNGKLIPDVFCAFCTESTYSFLAAAVGKKWVILGDNVLNHAKSVDGASSSSRHVSMKYGNTWNNLMCGRNALDFIHDKEAIDAGMGYEECASIMNHKKDAYDENGLCKDPSRLASVLNKYLFLTKEELNYDEL